MANHNETGDYPYDTDEYVKIDKIWQALSGGLSFACVIMFTITLIFGAISWTQIRPWRQFKNYVFLNITLSLFLMDAAYLGCFMDWPCCWLVLALTYRIAMSAFANWVLVMCMIIYTKILKVFSGELQHKYLKANAFAWGLAAIECVLPLKQFGVLIPNATLCVIHAMTYVIVGLYLSILYALLKLTTVRMVSTENTNQIIKIFIYVTSAFGILILMQGLYYFYEFHDVIFIGICCCEITLVFSFLTMKTHWEMWDDYLNGAKDVSNQNEIRIEGGCDGG